MPQDSKKPKWGKPKLIVITRGDRQERVLQSCKVGGRAGWLDEHAICYYLLFGDCELCYELSGS